MAGTVMLYTRKSLLLLAALALAVLTRPALGEFKTVEEKDAAGAVTARYTVGADGVRNGQFWTYYQGGKTKVSGEYLRGELNGAYNEFQPGGLPALRCSYRKGQLDGSWTAYDEKGTKKATGQYAAGKKNGVFAEYHAGALVSEQLFIDDVLLIPRSQAAVIAKLKEIQAAKITTAAPGDGEGPIPNHRGTSEPPVQSEAALRLLMQYRYLCSVPYDAMQLDALYTAHDEAAAAILVDINRLDHRPPNPGWPDADYKFAYTGTSSSNLYEGSSDPCRAVRAFMDDSDEKNIDRVGHRRWCLNPAMAKTGFGTAKKGFVAMWSMDQSRKEVADFDYVAYPAGGMFPSPYFAAGAAWSVSLNPAKFKQPDEKAIHVSVKSAQLVVSPASLRTQAELKVNYCHVDTGGYAIPNAIIFRFDRCSTQTGATYQVEITGLTTAAGEAAPPIKYIVEFFDPGKI